MIASSASAARGAASAHATTSPRPHVRQQRADGDGLRRDRDVDAAALHQLGVRGLVDQRHHLAGAEPLGEHRRQDVGLLGIGQRRERHSCRRSPRPAAPRRVRRPQHDRALEQLRDAARALRVALDDLDLVLLLRAAWRAGSRCGRHRRSPPAHRALLLAQLRHHLADVVARGEEEHLVAILDDRVAFRDALRPAR